MPDHCRHSGRVSTRAPRNPKADLIHCGRTDQTFTDQLIRETKMSEIEYFHFGFDSEFLVSLGHLPQHIRSLDINVIAVAEINGATVECCNVGSQLLYMCNPSFGVHHIRPRPRYGRIIVVNDEIAAHPGSQVDQHISPAVTNSANGLAK